MAYQSTNAMLNEMRDLGWDADADSWADYIAGDDFCAEDMRDIRADIKSELESMRNAEIIRNADHPETRW